MEQILDSIIERKIKQRAKSPLMITQKDQKAVEEENHDLE